MMSASSPEGGRAAPAEVGAGRALARILVIGGALRIALWAWAGAQPLSIWDERDYDALATNVVARGEYALDPGRPTSIRPPLYPAAVAGVYRLCGVGNHRAVRLCQAALSLATVLLVYRLGTTLHSRRVGVWAGGLYAFYPSLLAYNNLLLTEVLFTALLTASCCMLTRAFRRDSVADLLMGGVLLGLGALTRSVLWLFPPVLGLYLLAAWRGGPARRLAAASAMALGFAATVAPWSVRNSRLQETFVAVDVMGGRNFMMGNYRFTPMTRSWATIEIEGERSWVGVLAARHPGLPGMTQGQIDRLAQREAVRFVLDHPGLTARRDAVKFFDFWGLERELIAGAAEGHLGRISRPTLALMALVVFGGYALAMAAGIFGAVVWPSPDLRSRGLLLLVVAFVCGLHTLAFGHSRYHLPLIPLILVASAAALVHAREIWARRGGWRFRLACGLCGVLFASWVAGALVADLDRFVAALKAAS